ncbi:MAG: DUF4249 family protein [Bacteroidota bacterium]
MKPLLIFLLLLPCLACEPTESTLIDTEKAVIEAYLHVDRGVDSLRITKSISYQTDSLALPLEMLDVNLSDGTQTVLLDDFGKGYYGIKDWVIEADKTYVLSFTYADREVMAETYAPAKTPITISEEELYMTKVEGFNFGANADVEPVEISWENEQGDYYYVVVENLEEDPTYINADLQERLQAGENLPIFELRSEPTITDFYSVDARRQIQQFGTHRVIVFRVNTEYAALYQSAGNTSLSLADPPSNVQNGFGIFTAAHSDTVFFEVRER